MTPLAYRIVKDMTLPIKKRTFREGDSMLSHFRKEFHCFEVSQINETAWQLLGPMMDCGLPSVEWSFLPDERTWIEWKPDDGQHNERVGAMLVRRGAWADVYGVSPRPPFGGRRIGQLALCEALREADPSSRHLGTAIFKNVYVPRSTGMDLCGRAVLWKLYPFLLLINTPRVIGRTTHDPHRGLAREIVTNRKTLGIFPLQAWTEITLTTETFDASDEDNPKSSWLSGAMPFHWTRAHKRRVHGVWTLISDYWSGDGSLGIKQSRYKLMPAEQGQ